MAEGEAGALAPVVDAPVANTVIAPPVPAGGNQASPPEGDKPVTKTYTDDEVKKTVSERLAKERRRLERTVRAEIRAETAERRVQELETRGQPNAEKPKGPPKAKDYAEVEDYVRDLIKYERTQERETEQRERQEREPKERQANSQAEYARSLREKLSEGSEEYEDFDEVVFGDVPFTDPMVAAIHESDKPAKLAYYMGTHPEEVKRIGKLAPTRQVIEIAKIEDKMKAPPKPTGAPPPIVPSGGGNAGASKDWAQMNTEEHVKAYRNRDKRR